MMQTQDVTQHQQRPGHRVFRTRYASWRFNVRVLGMTLAGLVLLAILMIWAVTLGTIDLSMSEVIDATLGKGDDRTSLVVNTLRWPRIMSAVVIGCSLAISGLIFQGIARNPLVSPDIIGINAGATFAAVTWIVLQQDASLLPTAAFVGALLTAMAIYLLSWRGGVSPNRLILVGIGIGAIVSAGSSYMMIKFPLEQARPAIVWTMGSIYGSTWSDVLAPLVTLVILVPTAVLLMEPLRAMMLGDVVTRSLGIPLERTRLMLMVVGCALAAISVAIAGPIGFVALMVPHMARMIAGPHSGSVLIFTGVLGSLLLLLSDIAAQFAFPITLPVGVVTAAVGAPYFLFLLYRSNSHT